MPSIGQMRYRRVEKEIESVLACVDAHCWQMSPAIEDGHGSHKRFDDKPVRWIRDEGAKYVVQMARQVGMRRFIRGIDRMTDQERGDACACAVVGAQRGIRHLWLSTLTTKVSGTASTAVKCETRSDNTMCKTRRL